MRKQMVFSRMMRKATALLLAAMLLLGMTCQTAFAEGEQTGLVITLPDGNFVYGDDGLAEGDILTRQENEGTYRIDTTTGEYTRIGNASANYINGHMYRDAQGKLFVIGDGSDSETFERMLQIETLDETTGEWTITRQKSLTDTLDGAMLETIHDSLLVDGVLYAIAAVENMDKPMLLSWTLETDEAKLLGALGEDAWMSTKMFLRDHVICNADGDYERNVLKVFTYDIQTGQFGYEEYHDDALSLWAADDIHYLNGKYILMASTHVEEGATVTGIYSGESLENLTLVAAPVNSGSALIVMENRMLLASGNQLMDSSVISNAKVTLTLCGTEEYSNEYTIRSGVTFVSTWQDAADILNTRNSDVDIIAIRTDSWTDVSLSVVKQKGFFVDLSDNDVIMAQVDRLYPGLKSALMTEDGKLVGWYDNVDNFLPELFNEILYDYDMTFPTTLLEMCQQITTLDEADVFADEMMTPVGYPGYDRYSMLEVALERYFAEQQMLGNKITMDNAELKTLLDYIVAYVPLEAKDYGDEYGENTLFELEVGMPVTADCNLPLRVGESSPNTLPAIAQVMFINPYSKHQEEAIKYLEYRATNVAAENAYRMFADMTEPLLYDGVLEDIAELDAQIAKLEAQEQTAAVQDELAELRSTREFREQNKYMFSQEDIDFWHEAAQYMYVPEEALMTADFRKLVHRLAEGNLTVDGFVQEANRYFEMMYRERGE